MVDCETVSGVTLVGAGGGASWVMADISLDQCMALAVICRGQRYRPLGEALWRVVRSDSAGALCQDLLLPTLLQAALRVENVALRCLAALGALLVDLATLPVRLLTMPLLLFDRMGRDHPLEAWLQRHGADNALCRAGDLSLTLQWQETHGSDSYQKELCWHEALRWRHRQSDVVLFDEAQTRVSKVDVGFDAEAAVSEDMADPVGVPPRRDDLPVPSEAVAVQPSGGRESADSVPSGQEIMKPPEAIMPLTALVTTQPSAMDEGLMTLPVNETLEQGLIAEDIAIEEDLLDGVEMDPADRRTAAERWELLREVELEDEFYHDEEYGSGYASPYVLADDEQIVAEAPRPELQGLTMEQFLKVVDDLPLVELAANVAVAKELIAAEAQGDDNRICQGVGALVHKISANIKAALALDQGCITPCIEIATVVYRELIDPMAQASPVAERPSADYAAQLTALMTQRDSCADEEQRAILGAKVRCLQQLQREYDDDREYDSEQKLLLHAVAERLSDELCEALCDYLCRAGIYFSNHRKGDPADRRITEYWEGSAAVIDFLRTFATAPFVAGLSAMTVAPFIKHCLEGMAAAGYLPDALGFDIEGAAEADDEEEATL